MATRTLSLALTAVTTVAATGLALAHAAAADSEVTVSGIGRSGTHLVVGAGLVNLSSGRTFTLNGGTTAKVPAGRYAVGSYLVDYPSLTVAAREITVSGPTSVVFDAAKATKVSFDVGDSTVTPSALAVVPFVSAGGKEHTLIPDTGTEWPAENTYVLGDTSAKDVRLGVHGILTRHGSAPSPVRYDLAKSFKGMPTDASLRSKAGSLARVEMDVATLDEEQTAFLKLVPARPDGTPIDGVDLGQPVLGHLTSYRTPGLQWDSKLSMSSLDASAFLEEKVKDNKLLYAAGKTYRETWGHGVWGPRPGSPAIYDDNGTLKVGGGPPICAFSGQGVKLSDCQVQPQSADYQLYRDGKLLGRGNPVSARIDDSKPHWYVAQLSATRQNEGDLSTQVDARWYFQAGGTSDTRISPTETVRRKLQVQPGYLQISTGGLDEHNRAGVGSTTAITMSAVNFPDATAMTLDYSTDGGKTWQAVKLAKAGATWTGKITNPGQAGKISLRAGARTASGATVNETVTNSYAVH